VQTSVNADQQNILNRPDPANGVDMRWSRR